MTDENDVQPGGGSIDTVLTSIRRMLQEGKEAHAAAQTAASAAEADAQPQHHETPAEPVMHEPPPAEDDDVLVLDASMQAPPEEEAPVEQPAAVTPEPVVEASASPAEPIAEAAPEPEAAETHAPEAAPEEVPAAEEPVIHAESQEQPSAVPVPVSEPVAQTAPVEAAEPKREAAVESIPTQLARIRMSDNNNAAETPGYTGASDAEVPTPVQIALDKQTVGATEHSFGALQQMLRRQQAVEHKERRVAITRGGNLTIEDIVRDEVRAFLKEWLDQHLSGIVQQAVQKEIERLSDR